MSPVYVCTKNIHCKFAEQFTYMYQLHISKFSSPKVTVTVTCIEFACQTADKFILSNQFKRDQLL